MSLHSGITGQQYTATYTFGDESLHPYELRASQRLDIILEQLDLGSPANLGYTRVTWLPDRIARIRYTVMEGILEPIIIVKIDFQEAELARRKRDADVEDELEKEEEEEQEYPGAFMWVGITTFDHKLVDPEASDAEENPNCEFWGWPIDSALYGFDPREAERENPFGFADSCETLPGSLLQGGSFLTRAGEAYPDTPVSDQLSIQIHDGQDWTNNGFLLENGTFQDGHWILSAKGVVSVTTSGMMSAEHMDVTVTAPNAAFEAVRYPDDDPLDDPHPIPAGYWRRSISVNPNGHQFPLGVFSQTIMVIDNKGTASNSARYFENFIPCEVRAGTYEIGCFVTSFSCECSTAQVHIRVVLGSGIDRTIYDIFPLGIGQNPTEVRYSDYWRQLSLGGAPGPGEYCLEALDNIFGGNDGGIGWWPFSLFINIVTNTLNIAPGTRLGPHFNFACPQPTTYGPDHPACASGCDGNPISQPANFLDYGKAFYGVTYKINNDIRTWDLRESVLWHLARVEQVDSGTGHICFIKLVGNDGGRGGPCLPCQSFSHGHTLRAVGIRSNIELGADLAKESGGGIDSFTVGELVCVIGFTDFFNVICGIVSGDWRLIVVRPHGAGQDFTAESWKELRCPGFPAVDRFFDDVEIVLAHRIACLESGPGPPAPIPTVCECLGDQLRCIN